MSAKESAALWLNHTSKPETLYESVTLSLAVYFFSSFSVWTFILVLSYLEAALAVLIRGYTAAQKSVNCITCCFLIAVVQIFLFLFYLDPCLLPWVSESTGCPYRLRPGVSPSPVWWCHSSGIWPWPQMRSRSPGWRSAVSVHRGHHFKSILLTIKIHNPLFTLTRPIKLTTIFNTFPFSYETKRHVSKIS